MKCGNIENRPTGTYIRKSTNSRQIKCLVANLFFIFFFITLPSAKISIAYVFNT